MSLTGNPVDYALARGRLDALSSNRMSVQEKLDAFAEIKHIRQDLDATSHDERRLLSSFGSTLLIALQSDDCIATAEVSFPNENYLPWSFVDEAVQEFLSIPVSEISHREKVSSILRLFWFYNGPREILIARRFFDYLSTYHGADSLREETENRVYHENSSIFMKLMTRARNRDEAMWALIFEREIYADMPSPLREFSIAADFYLARERSKYRGEDSVEFPQRND